MKYLSGPCQAALVREVFLTLCAKSILHPCRMRTQKHHAHATPERATHVGLKNAGLWRCKCVRVGVVGRRMVVGWVDMSGREEEGGSVKTAPD